MHFFNPAPVLPLVEVMRTERTDDDVFETAFAFCRADREDADRCHDTPGFVVNRDADPDAQRRIRVLDEGARHAEDIDNGMKNGAGWPMGPCELVDLVGVDVHVHASEAIHAALGEPRMAPPERLVQMRREGRLGRKSGRGFYEY